MNLSSTALLAPSRQLSWAITRFLVPGLLAVALLAGGAQAAPTDDVYLLGPDSQPQEGVPQGKVIGPLTLPSNVFTNTTRHYWIYVPAQYDAAKPAALMIFQDGHAFLARDGAYRATHVFDNLIHRREMPVTIGVFINPGRRPDQQESSAADWGDRINNRPTEYNELNDNYAKMIVDELLPALKKDYVSKLGQAVNLGELRKQKLQVQEYVTQLEKQLPGKAEMDALLSDINQAGLGRGLQFELFKPAATENAADFYAELPINIRVTGSYHDIGAFASDVAKLSRIVLLNDVNILPGKDGGLSMDAVAKTYRYLDEDEIAKQRKTAKGAAKK